LGLASYYRRFVSQYGAIAKPLTDMLKKDNFSWSSTAKEAFQELKQRLVASPVLALPDFSKEFVVEVDASGLGLGVVLMQNHHPIAFISRSLNTQQQSLSTYEKELLAIVFAVQKWRHYLPPKKFIIRNDHRCLKYILEQRLSTTFQQKWLVKLMEFDFNIEYREGRENMAADALSRLDSPEIMALQVYQPNSSMLSRIRQSWQKDPILQQLVSDLKSNPSSQKHYTWVRNELRRKGRLVIGSDSQLRQDILSWIHASACGGHSSRDATLQKMKNVVYWRGVSKAIKFFVFQCATC